AVVRKLMAKQPEDRFQTPTEVIAALGSGVMAGGGVRAPEPRPAPVTSRAFSPAPRAVVVAGSDTVRGGEMPAEVKRVTRRRRLMVIGAAAGALLCALVVWLTFFRGTRSTKTQPTDGFVARPINMKMVPIPAGTFTMGSSPEEIDRVSTRG